MFACERYGIEPDLLVTAKSLGGGLPLGAVTGRADIMDAAGEGGLGGTFGGNPVCVEAGLAVLDLFEQGDLCARANELGSRFARRARQWQEQWPQIGEVRGLGGMQAMELVQPHESREPAAKETKEIVRYCYEHGLIVLSAGSYGNVIRLLMPLVMTDEQFEEALGVLEAALKAVLQTRGVAVQTA
jgi:4-aminobutyrate aminotransferase/(S)-3-amino-2-methylpropionate transaminase